MADDAFTYADVDTLDLTDPVATAAFVCDLHPDYIINCAAYTAVDRAETDEARCRQVNRDAVCHLASAAQAVGARVVHISTDYVFGGELDRPYHEFDVAGGAHTVYGASKFAGEELIRRHCPNHLICRISWLYGAGGPSFVHAMLKLADGSRPELKVVDDQHGNPTSAIAVARQLRNILARPELVGTFHMTCEGEATWHEFAEEIFRLAGVRQKLRPCATAEFSRPAPRPANSRLEKRMLRLCGLPPMSQWRDALGEFMRSEFNV